MYKILVVDDEKEIVNVLEEFLTKTGYEVLIALSGSKAIEIINSDLAFDLIIVDLKMPEVNGFEVIKRLKETNRNIPVIVLSGVIKNGKESDDLKCLGYNEEDILYKPIDPPQFLDMIKKKLSKKP